MMNATSYRAMAKEITSEQISALTQVLAALDKDQPMYATLSEVLRNLHTLQHHA